MNFGVSLSRNSRVAQIFWWRQLTSSLFCVVQLVMNNFSITLNVKTNYARNYENLLNFIKVRPMLKILAVPFFSGHDDLGGWGGLCPKDAHMLDLLLTLTVLQYLSYTVQLVTSGGSRGSGPPYFWQSQFNFFYIVYNVWKNIFEIEFGFYSGRNRMKFLEVWGCMRVCVNRNRGRYCFLFSKGPILNDIRGHSDPENICEIAGNRI